MKQTAPKQRNRTTGALMAFLVAAGLATTPALAADALQGADGATLLLEGGRVHTPNGIVEAMAVDARGVIIAVGSTSDIEKFKGPSTKVIELNGQTVLPGLHDLHVHPIYAGVREHECKIPQGSTLKQAQAVVKTCADKVGAGKWVFGGQWDVPALGQEPDRQQLDAIAPSNPVLLEDTSGHSAWANSKAIEIAGLTRDTPDPEGGIVERDANGVPTGILRESAVDLVKKYVPLPSEEEVQSALTWSIKKMLSYGITSFTEAAVGFTAGEERELKAYTALADSGVLKQRVRVCITWQPGDKTAEAMIASRNLFARERLSPSCVKIFLDGVPTDSHTAAMLEPYVGTVAGRDDEAARKGMLLIKQDVLNKALIRFDRMGLTVKFHSVGDAAVRAGLTAIAAARKANGFTGQLHDVGHCTFVAKEDIPRAREIGATYEVSPYLWGPTPSMTASQRRSGPS